VRRVVLLSRQKEFGKKMRVCKNCVLPETFPGIRFDEDGVCNFCLNLRGKEYLEESKEKQRKKFDDLLERYRGRGSYDCLMAYSGGKDSTYTLALLRKEYDLKILALTFDNGFIPQETFHNIRNVAENLRIDHLLFKPRFDLLKKIFLRAVESDLYSRKTLERASTICTSCMGLVKFFSLRTSLEKNIPFIAYGWSPGQAPLSSSIFKNNKSMLKTMQNAIFDPLYKIVGEEIRPYFLEQHHFEEDIDFPYNISPLSFLEYDEERIFRNMQDLGWTKPKDTDPNSTNCLLNGFANLVHKERFGFHPYALELANLVRQGHLDRQEALNRINAPEDLTTVSRVRRKLGLASV
jgi:tRNA(Ile)-lysidine synthase TilS/MesJ